MTKERVLSGETKYKKKGKEKEKNVIWRETATDFEYFDSLIFSIYFSLNSVQYMSEGELLEYKPYG